MKRMRGVVTLLALPVLLPVAAAMLWSSNMPRNVAGMAAHTVCSGTFVAGRPWQQVLQDDLLTANPFFGLVTVQADLPSHAIVATFPGGTQRRAVWLPQRGCVLDTPPPPDAVAAAPAAAPSVTPVLLAFQAAPEHRVAADQPGITQDARRSTDSPARWPDGDAPWPMTEWPTGVDVARLSSVADAAMSGAGDPKAANARGLAVVYGGRLLVSRQGPGYEIAMPLHGWSMSKTVVGLLVDKLAREQGMSLDRPVVDWFAGREPDWVGPWRTDERRRITVADLIYMRDGLDNEEGYMPWGEVPSMLFGVADVAGYAARARAARRPGERWRYSSFSSNLLAGVVRARFDTDAAYWAYPARALFGPIGASTAAFETDRDGTWLASSYLWASTGDWARLGRLLLDDGRWGDRRVLPAGVLARAMTPASRDGAGRGYGGQIWRLGDPVAGECRQQVPEDTLAMSGHWGQVVAIVPSHDAVIVRLGWTVTAGAFDACRLIADVLQALPTRDQPDGPMPAAPLDARDERRPGGEANVSALGATEGSAPPQARSNTAAMP